MQTEQWNFARSIRASVWLGNNWINGEAAQEIFASWKGEQVVLRDPQVGIAPWMQGFPEVLLCPGEQNKTREEKARLEDALFQMVGTAPVRLIAVGGGVTTDLVGYLAATFCRGVPWIAVPTSLVGMVDAALGGKTGVNTSYGKNLIGAFHPASHVMIDTSYLKTLPAQEKKNGMAEIIKYACIASPSLFELLHGEESLEQWIAESIQIKKQVVEADFQDQGYRRILNFGHTVGHAIEHLTRHKIPHGEAVAIGMWIEARCSYEMGYLSREEIERIEHLLLRYEFYLHLPVSVDKLLSMMAFDKKGLRMVCLTGIGKPAAFDGQYCGTIDPKIWEAVCHGIFNPLI